MIWKKKKRVLRVLNKVPSPQSLVQKLNCRIKSDGIINAISPETKVSGCQKDKSAKETASKTPESQSQGGQAFLSP
jgi:hypothetical protein